MSKIPNTDIEVSQIGLGTMNFGAPVNQPDAIDLIRHALDNGINHIDTANMYEGYTRYRGSHGGVAERFIGQAVKGAREKFVIATKFGMSVGDMPEDEGCGQAALAKQLDRSLKYLETDYVDIYYAHKYDSDTRPEELADAMKRAVDAGKIRCWGVSNYSGAQLSSLLVAADANGLPRPVVCQPQLSLLKHEALDDVITVCAREKIGVIPYQALCGGLLTNKYKRGGAIPENSRAAESGWLTLDDATFQHLEAIDADAKSHGMTMMQYAIRWVAACPSVVSVLIGAKNKTQIDDALASCR
ncbi:MAG: aldo/keto reductase [Synergistaceae bacterium]|jgi:aryl-alcohol dehydrogenase-like predicted oxidoreductase|nr:aldo/keto reductase [Synergistaceae bacterium]